jgi:putative thioredoxin
VVRFLEHNLPSEGAGEAVSGLDLWRAGDIAGAIRAFSEVLREEPKNPVALIGLGHCMVDQGDLEGAREKMAAVNEAELDRLPDRPQMEKLLASLKGRIFLLEHAAPDGGDASELTLRFGQACQAALDGNFEPALETFLGIVRSDRKFKDDAGRRGMVAVFDLLPPQHPLTQAYRQKLSTILFS